MASAGDKNFVGLSLNASDYPGERFSFDGTKAKVANTVNGQKSFFANFINSNDLLLRESCRRCSFLVVGTEQHRRPQGKAFLRRNEEDRRQGILRFELLAEGRWRHRHHALLRQGHVPPHADRIQANVIGLDRPHDRRVRTPERDTDEGGGRLFRF